MDRLTRLQRLNLDGNDLRCIPSPVFSMRGLKVLRVCDNLLDELPVEIILLTNLKEFYAKENRIRNISQHLDEFIRRLLVFQIDLDKIEGACE